MRALLVILAGCGTSAATATGAVGAWTMGPPLPTARANHCSVGIGDWLVVIGGNREDNGTFVKTDEIHAAKLEGGVLGAWVLAGHTAAPVTECNAATDGKTLYVAGGIYDDAADNGAVWSGAFADGAVTLAMTAMLPDGDLAVSTAAAWSPTGLIVIDSEVGGDTETLAGAATTTWGIGFRSQAQFVVGDTFAYTLGGYSDPAVGAVADTFVAALNGPGVATTPLPMPIGWGEGALVDDWMFVVGGRASTFASDGTTAVIAAPVAADGTLGAWQWETALPVERTNHSMALVGDYLVVTGGATSGPGDDQVMLAKVR